MSEKSSFLSEKYTDLPGSKPVDRAVQKKLREGEAGPQTKEERVEAYLDRLEAIIREPMGYKEEQGDRGGFDLLKSKILGKYITKYQDIPVSYWQAQEQELRRRGEAADWAQTSEEQKEEVKRKTATTVLADQRASLEQWIDYFSSPDSKHIPRELKYWVFRNILNLSDLVKKKEGDREYIEFPKRSRGTVKPFPDLNYEALAYVAHVMDKKLQGENIEFEYDIQPAEREAFERVLQKQDFAKLYAWANELMQPIPAHLLPVTEGRWVKYEQESEAQELVKTIRGKGTGWCTAGLTTAKTQLQGGDFWVYYSLDDQGQPTMPRIAIRLEGHDKIAEDPRGIAYKQNLDPYMGQVLEDKLKEFGPIGDAYKKKSADMKLLTTIEHKTKQNQPLTKQDLIFLYELESTIEGFGYQKDPRIKELISQRNQDKDMQIIFDCTSDQIARTSSEINNATRVYVGKLEKGILYLIEQYNIEHIYTSFPENRIRIERDFEVKPITPEEFERQRGRYNQGLTDESLKIQISSYAQDMFKHQDFATLKDPEKMSLIRLKVSDLGFVSIATTQEIYQKAAELGLELCPAEVGPSWRLKYTNQPLNKRFRIAMKQIPDRSGVPRVFDLVRSEDGLWLGDGWAEPDDEWDPDDGFVFCSRKLKS